MKKIPNYLISIDEDDKDSGVFAVSFVSRPAIKSSFVALNESKELLKLKKDSKKQILSGFLLIPGQQIPRVDKNGQYYTIEYTAEVIEQIAHKFLKDKNTSYTTSEHEIELDSNYLVETWLVADSKCDKSIALGICDEPIVGSWGISYKINDPEYWANEIESGNKTGFSLEGFFSLTEQKLAEIKTTKNMSLKTKIKQKIKDFAKSIALEEIELKNGDTLSVDDETGDAFINDEVAEDGDYETADGETVTVADGKVDLSAVEPVTEVAPESVVEPELIKQDDVQYVSRYTVKNTDGTDGDVIDVQYVATAKTPTGESIADGQYQTANNVTLVIKSGNVVDYLYDTDMYMSAIQLKETEISNKETEILKLKEQISKKDELIKQLENEPKVQSVKKEETKEMKMSEGLTPGQAMVQKLKMFK